MRSFIALLLTALAFSGCNTSKPFTSQKAFSKACHAKQKPEHQKHHARVFNSQFGK